MILRQFKQFKRREINEYSSVRLLSRGKRNNYLI
nr:MAG TPA: hypothetical protein [Caudoviricetes sp.]